MHRARPTTQRRFQWSAPSLPTSSGARLKNQTRSEEHTSELQSQSNLVCRLLLEKKKIYLMWPRRSTLATRRVGKRETVALLADLISIKLSLTVSRRCRLMRSSQRVRDVHCAKA